MDNELRDLIIRIDERVKSLTEKLDSFMENTKQSYLCKEQFNKWESDEFVPVKEKLQGLSRLQWLLIGSLISSAGAMVVGIFFK